MVQPATKRLVRESDLTDPETPAGAALLDSIGSQIASDGTPAHEAVLDLATELLEGVDPGAFEAAVSTAAEGLDIALRSNTIGRQAPLTDSPYQPERLTVGRPRMILSDGKYNGFSSIVRTATGRLLVSFSHGDGHDVAGQTIWMAYSDDHGATWTIIEDVFTPTGTQRMKAFHPTLIDGDLVGVGWYRDTGTTPASGQMYMSTSTDNGLTWSARVNMDDQAYSVLCSNEQAIIVLESGRWLLSAYGYDGATDFFSSSVGYSDDDGETWTWVEIADGPGTSEVWAEPTLAVLSNGNIQALIRNETDETIWRVVSNNGGESWGVGGYTSVFPNNGKPAQVVTSEGSIVCMVRETSAGGDGYVRFSRDDGVTWSEAQLLTNGRGTFAYASGVEVWPGVVAVSASHDSGTSGEVSDLMFLYLADQGGVTPFGDNDLWARSPHAAMLRTSGSRVIAFDTMERADESPAGRMDSGHVWYNWGGGGHELVAGRLKSINASDPSGAVSAIDLRRSDYHEILTSVLVTSGAFGPGIIFQMFDESNYYVLSLSGSADTVLPELYKRVAGSFTLLDDAPTQNLGLGVEYPVRVTIRAGRIKCWLDDEKVIDVVDTTFTTNEHIGFSTSSDTKEIGPLAVLF